jgi:hypothetical protein
MLSIYLIQVSVTLFKNNKMPTSLTFEICNSLWHRLRKGAWPCGVPLWSTKYLEKVQPMFFQPFRRKYLQNKNIDPYSKNCG